ncbi:MAG: aromatic ring-hydroxylating dioxygenase subunit alpha [Gammaproteobacteria bacterium]|nr:aromatic ring-hydroxylating dioxygenase subunit alpha [Gammaproteobacteria bacterium]
MGEVRSIFGRPFLIDPDAAPGSPDAKWPDPPLGQNILTDHAIYHSREHFAREWNDLWARTWNIAGRESDAARPGDFFRFDLGPESFIVVRGEDGALRAFYNVCQHRGSQLVDEDFGRRRKLVCPFHSWCWKLDGRLERVTDRETFADAVVADEPPLAAARVATWGGFVFVNMDLHAAPLTDYLAELPGILDVYRPEDLVVVKDVSATWPINWKIGLDAFMEGYHAHMRHPELIRLIDDYHFQHDLFGRGHSRMIIPFARKSPRLPDPDALTPELGVLLAEAGLDPADFAGRAQDLRAPYIAARRAWGERYGLDFGRYSDSQVADDWNLNVFPNVTLNVHPEGILVMRFRPHASDPETCHYDVWVLARTSPVAGFRLPFYMDAPDADLSGQAPRPARRYIRHGEDGMGAVLDQDGAQLPLVQRGVRSRGFGGVRLGYQEIRLRHYYEEYHRYLPAR